MVGAMSLVLLMVGGILTLSSSIFCTMKVATVLDSSLPISMVRKHRGMISVDKRKFITSVSSTCSKSVESDRAGEGQASVSNKC